MKKTILLLIFTIVSLLSSAQEKNEKSTYFFIRHAEKELNVKNPDLTKKGEQRALNWVKILHHYKIDEVFSTNFKRTIQTALPIAKKYKLQTQIYHPFKFNIEKILSKYQGKNIVIVGHSNTIPSLVNKFIGQEKYKDINESIYGNLYIVTVDKKSVHDIMLSIE
ncbi:phosphoglycerate mutase family protein [Tenacibaculum sp. ZS6-P6]|uniref:phosphoglycerate mutase family protein n=1 Tax=Tenacibaculum sp. ZS6-P6 TaxID=3447503 RepID=UPI003F957600